MKKVIIKEVDPLQAGKVLGVIYFVVSLFIFVPIFIFFIAALSDLPKDNPLNKTGPLFLIFVPIMYALFAFLMGIVSAIIYNVTLRFHGGFQLLAESQEG